MEGETAYLLGSKRKKSTRNAWYSVDLYMLPGKVSYFVNCTRSAICDYLVLFYVQTGLTPFEAGLVNGLQHLGGIIAAPFFGLLADKYGFRRVITIFLCMAAILAMCMQPYLARTFGRRDQNVCPAKKNNLSNTTTNVGNIPFLNSTSHLSYTTRENQLFYSLLGSAVLASSFDGSIMSFIEAGVLTRLKSSPTQNSIGSQRIMAAIGTSLGAFIYSVSVHYFPHGRVACYVGLFIVYFALTAILAACFYFLFKGISIADGKEKSTVAKQFFSHLVGGHNFMFLLTVLFYGTVPATLYSYLFLYLIEEFNAPTLLCGLSVSVNSISGVFIYTISPKLIKLVGGPINAMCLSGFAWSIPLLCIAYLQNPYYILLIDICHGFTYSLFKVSSLQYVKEETDVAIFSSMCGVVNALSYSCAFLLANIAGGKIYVSYGPRNLFIGLSVACVIWSFLMFSYIMLAREFSRRKDL